MDLIYYRGLNCHLAGIVNIAFLLGVNYTDAFAALWSETDFTDEVKYNIYVSKRVFANLKEIGVITELLSCGEMKAGEDLSRIPDGEMLLVGMDTFYIPWHPVSGHFHDSHYFFARKEAGNSVLCFDPVYNKKDIRIKAEDISPHAFELGRVYRLDSSPPEYNAEDEAREILRCHPETAEKLLAEVLSCESAGKINLTVLIKQINAMVNNRYLFKRFLDSHAAATGFYGTFFNEAFFSKWEAVRNGLYKATIVEDNKNVIDKVHDMLSDLIREEMSMAREMIAKGTATEF